MTTLSIRGIAAVLRLEMAADTKRYGVVMCTGRLGLSGGVQAIAAEIRRN